MEKVRSIPEFSISRDCGPTKEDIKKFDHLRDVPIASMDQPVCLLIGADTPEAFFHLEERRGNRTQPIAIKTPLGWTIQGPSGKKPPDSLVSSVNYISNEELDEKLSRLWKHDFPDSMTSNKTAMSKDDKFVMEQLTETQEIFDGRYRFGMPWKTAPELIESNYKVAEKRAMLLQRKVKSSDQFLLDGYKQAMDKNLNQDNARKLNASEVNINKNDT